MATLDHRDDLTRRLLTLRERADALDGAEQVRAVDQRIVSTQDLRERELVGGKARSERLDELAAELVPVVERLIRATLVRSPDVAILVGLVQLVLERLDVRVRIIVVAPLEVGVLLALDAAPSALPCIGERRQAGLEERTEEDLLGPLLAHDEGTDALCRTELAALTPLEEQ